MVFVAAEVTLNRSKREAIFLILPILVLELTHYKNLVINLRTVTVGLLLSVVVMLLIIAMSITRGYGNFEVDSVIEASGYIFQYEPTILNDKLLNPYKNYHRSGARIRNT